MACSVCAPRYCASKRCYCGHEECDAFATFVRHVQPKTTAPVYDNDAVAAAPAPAQPSAWDEREGPTWIDNL